MFRKDLNSQELVNLKGRSDKRVGKERLRLAEKKMEEIDCEKLEARDSRRHTKQEGGVDSRQTREIVENSEIVQRCH